jgi:hypothetical protein
MAVAPLKVTAEQAEVLEALRAGRHDIEYFAWRVLGLEVNHAQRRWFKLIRPQENGWEWRVKAVLHVAANQIGKTLGLAVIILWAGFYKIGVPTDDEKRWFASPYQWFHVAPTQNQAYLPLKDAILLIQGVHPAQRGKCLLPKGLITQTKIETYYDGLAFWNGAVVQFRTTEDKAKALQGRRAAGVSMDECAFEDHLKAVVNETLLMRLISTGGPFIGVSTPNGINDWFEMIQAIIDESPTPDVAVDGHWALGGSCKVGEPIPIWETPEEWALLWSTIEDNIGFGITPEEAARMERDLDPATKEQQLRGAFLEPADAFFVPIANVQACFSRQLPEAAEPLPNHRYVIAWDPSSASDPTVAVVLDVTKRPWIGVNFKYFSKPLGETKLLLEIYALHALYNGYGMQPKRGEVRSKAITVFDETSMGGAMLRQQLARLSPKRGINLAGPSTKRVLLTNLRAALNAKAMRLPSGWLQLMRELLNYKLPDDKLRQDSVMALLCAVEIAARGFSGETTARFRPAGRTTRRNSYLNA